MHEPQRAIKCTPRSTYTRAHYAHHKSFPHHEAGFRSSPRPEHVTDVTYHIRVCTTVHAPQVVIAQACSLPFYKFYSSVSCISGGCPFYASASASVTNELHRQSSFLDHTLHVLIQPVATPHLSFLDPTPHVLRQPVATPREIRFDSIRYSSETSILFYSYFIS